jgi:hypothetical protein
MRMLVGNRRRLEILKRSELCEKDEDSGRATKDGNMGGGGEVLNDTDAVPLWCLAGTDHAPLGIVELAGINELGRLVDGRHETTHMGNGRRKVKAIEHL